MSMPLGMVMRSSVHRSSPDWMTSTCCIRICMVWINTLLLSMQAAARAAERRARDNVWCPCDQGTGIGYNDDDDVIIVEDSQHVGETPATQQAQVVKCAGIHSNTAHLLPSEIKQQECARTDGQQASAQPAGVKQAAKPLSLASEGMQQEEQLQREVQSLNESRTMRLQNAEAVVDLTDDQSAQQQPDAKRTRVDVLNIPNKHEADCQMTSYNQQEQQHCLDTHDGGVSASEWACDACTLLNANLTMQCAACGQARPADAKARKHVPEQTLPQSCSVGARTQDYTSSNWSCKFCSLVNVSNSTHCSACAQWRYSHGMPHASRPTV